MTRLTWTAEDLGAFAACNGLTFVPPALLEHLVDQVRRPSPARPRTLLEWLFQPEGTA